MQWVLDIAIRFNSHLFVKPKKFQCNLTKKSAHNPMVIPWYYLKYIIVQVPWDIDLSIYLSTVSVSKSNDTNVWFCNGCVSFCEFNFYLFFCC